MLSLGPLRWFEDGVVLAFSSLEGSEAPVFFVPKCFHPLRSPESLKYMFWRKKLQSPSLSTLSQEIDATAIYCVPHATSTPVRSSTIFEMSISVDGKQSFLATFVIHLNYMPSHNLRINSDILTKSAFPSDRRNMQTLNRMAILSTQSLISMGLS